MPIPKEKRRHAWLKEHWPEKYLRVLKREAIRNKKNNKAKRGYFLEKLHERREKCGRFPQRRWTEDEVEYVREHYESMKIEDMAIYLGRSYGSVERKKNFFLGLQRNHKWNL